ncbi:MAG: hypothetical protein ACI31M_00195 [Bacilli bacterium]
MEKSIVIYLKSKKNYYEYFKENSFWIKTLNRGVNVKELENFIKNKYRLKTTDRISEVIDNLDLINTMLSNLN